MSETKTRAEIQRAHDILHFIAAPEAPAIFDGPGDVDMAVAVHDALAWVLGFDCGEEFQKNLDAISEEIGRRGFREVSLGRACNNATCHLIGAHTPECERRANTDGGPR